MKRYFFQICTLIVLCCYINTGCQKEQNTDNLLNGKWIFLGYGNNSTSEFEPEPYGESKSSCVIFNNGEAVAYSSINHHIMTYELDGDDQIIISGGLISYAMDTEWGNRFLRAFEDTMSFSIHNDELLFVGSDEFMKLRKELK